jgi:hypothetical protein
VNNSVSHSCYLCPLPFRMTSLASVPIDRCSPAQRAAAAATFHARSSEKERLLIVRPGVGDFLERLSLAFDFSFCTMGSRRYAEQIVERFRALFPRVQWASCCETVRRTHRHAY